MAAPDTAGYVLMNIMRDIDFLEANGHIDRSQAQSMRYPLKQHMHLAEPFLADSADAGALASAQIPPPAASPPHAASIPAQLSAMSLASSAPPPFTPAQSPSAPAQERAKVIWDHMPKPEDTDELLLRKNDVVIITERSSDEWWKGYVQGRDSSSEDRLFPANYVEVIKAVPLPPRPSGGVGQRAVPVPPPSSHAPAGAGPSTGTRARFTSSRTGTAPTAAPSASPTGLQTETEEMRKERQAKMTRVANSNAGRHAIGGFAAGAGAGIARSIF